jgi:hypothetical protein
VEKETVIVRISTTHFSACENESPYDDEIEVEIHMHTQILNESVRIKKEISSLYS